MISRFKILLFVTHMITHAVMHNLFVLNISISHTFSFVYMGFISIWVSGRLPLGQTGVTNSLFTGAWCLHLHCFLILLLLFHPHQKGDEVACVACPSNCFECSEYNEQCLLYTLLYYLMRTWNLVMSRREICIYE